MKFSVGDRVEWADGHPGRGVVIDVQEAASNRSRGNGEVRVRVQWDTGVKGWGRPDNFRYLDVVTRLGDVVR